MPTFTAIIACPLRRRLFVVDRITLMLHSLSAGRKCIVEISLKPCYTINNDLAKELSE